MHVDKARQQGHAGIIDPTIPLAQRRHGIGADRHDPSIIAHPDHRISNVAAAIHIEIAIGSNVGVGLCGGRQRKAGSQKCDKTHMIVPCYRSAA